MCKFSANSFIVTNEFPLIIITIFWELVWEPLWEPVWDPLAGSPTFSPLLFSDLSGESSWGEPLNTVTRNPSPVSLNFGAGRPYLRNDSIILLIPDPYFSIMFASLKIWVYLLVPYCRDVIAFKQLRNCKTAQQPAGIKKFYFIIKYFYHRIG